MKMTLSKKYFQKMNGTAIESVKALISCWTWHVRKLCQKREIETCANFKVI